MSRPSFDSSASSPQENRCEKRLERAHGEETHTSIQRRMAPRYCKKCKLVFDADACPGSHANFMYALACLPLPFARLVRHHACAPRQSRSPVVLVRRDRFTKTIPDGAAVAEPAAAAPAEDAKPKPPARAQSTGTLAVPAGLGAMLGGPPAGAGTGGAGAKAPAGLGALIGGGGTGDGDKPPGRAKSVTAPEGLGAMLGGAPGGALKAPAGLGALIGGGGPPAGRGGSVKAPAGLGALIGGGGPPAGRGGGVKAPAGLGALIGGAGTPPTKLGSTTIFDEPTTPLPGLDHSVAKSRAHCPKSTPRQRRPSSRRNLMRASLGTPPAMDPPVREPEPEPDDAGAVRRTTTTTRKRAEDERAPIVSSLQEEDEAGDERHHGQGRHEELNQDTSARAPGSRMRMIRTANCSPMTTTSPEANGRLLT